ncbi:DUF975 family protein [Clostridium beijerinckii]|uniref:DUF975 family protein n=1 Tax=Clostridium beijerinckii TaxID=1520 RepID=UPI00047B594F|nr:DUF975 family protein [Clostridium beijerinckii]
MKISELKRKSKKQLKGKWGLAITTLFVSLVIISVFYVVMQLLQPDGGILPIIGECVSAFLGGMATLGTCKFVLNLASNNNKEKFNDLFVGVNIYFKTLGLWILINISMTIATLCMVIPGIIVALMFSQAFFILCEDNNKSIMECLKQSVSIMRGYKIRLLLLELSFVGWGIISILTFGIGLLWIYPYRQVTLANFYLEIKK